MARKVTITATVRSWPLNIPFARSEFLRCQNGDMISRRRHRLQNSRADTHRKFVTASRPTEGLNSLPGSEKERLAQPLRMTVSSRRHRTIAQEAIPLLSTTWVGLAVVFAMEMLGELAVVVRFARVALDSSVTFLPDKYQALQWKSLRSATLQMLAMC
jgi:hypothetical protein